MHRLQNTISQTEYPLQNTISQTQYPYNKENMPLILPHIGFENGPLRLELDTLPKRHSSDLDTELLSVFIDFRSPFFGFKPQQQP